MNTQHMTFGKFNGWGLGDLARTAAGRRYLTWAADSLRSPQWRDACAAALRGVPADQVDTNVNLAARALMAEEPSGYEDIYDAERAVVEDREEAARLAAEEARQSEAETAIYAEFAGRIAAAGLTVTQARKGVAVVIRDYERPEDAPADRFSTTARREIAVEIARRIIDAGLSEWGW